MANSGLKKTCACKCGCKGFCLCQTVQNVWGMLTPRLMLIILAAGMAFMTLVSFVLQLGFHVLPCPMCWWQRIIHYIIFAVALVGIYKPQKPKVIVAGIILLALTGLSIGLWQFLAQFGLVPFPESCQAAAFNASNPADMLNAMSAAKLVVPCNKENFHLLGLTLAGWNILAMTATVVWAMGVCCVSQRAKRLAK